MEVDWYIVVEKNPQGYVEFNDGKEAVYGPVKSVRVNEENGFVEIEAKWVAKRPLGNMGIPTGDVKWSVVSSVPALIVVFPNLMVPFDLEDIPEKGPRVRFGLSVLYFNDVQKVDPSEVEGLQLVPT